ncbi:unnamed protein product [Protopolystoma xenopodis]|uniref:Tyrosine-protein phosphatase domain-containing protein n=1 Tax=Protopolystoma xenopodis TaxID=117903 RepID=A0A3S5B3S1_9PLAT|nr:unnamed protein product [Protopolystoma xenopodis]
MSAFIVIDSQLERLKHEQSVDVFGAVSRMRSQRNFMVQTEEQYAFLYDVLVEAVETIDTEVLASGLYQHLMKLRQPASNTLLAQYLGIDNRREPGHLNSNMSGLELEYKHKFAIIGYY